MDYIRVGDTLLNPFRSVTTGKILRVDGLIASGEKLIADVDSGDRKRISSTNDKTLAVEMEAAGVGRAVNRFCPGAEMVVLKGISDNADKNKNLITEEAQKKEQSNSISKY